jgi:hypothetical protein
MPTLSTASPNHLVLTWEKEAHPRAYALDSLIASDHFLKRATVLRRRLPLRLPMGDRSVRIDTDEDEDADDPPRADVSGDVLGASPLRSLSCELP